MKRVSLTVSRGQAEARAYRCVLMPRRGRGRPETVSRSGAAPFALRSSTLRRRSYHRNPANLGRGRSDFGDFGPLHASWRLARRARWLAGRGRESEPVSDLHDACMTDLNSIILYAYSLRKIMHEPNWMLGGSICHSELFLSDSPAR